MAHTHGQRRLLSATRRGVLLLSLLAAACLAIAAALVTPNWSPLPRSPLPDPSVANVGDRIVVRERPAPTRHPSDAAEPGRAPLDFLSEDPPAPAAAPEVERPSPVAAQPGVVVSAPPSPEREASSPGGDRAAPAPAPLPAPVPEPAPPTEAESPAEAPPPPQEAVISTHPGQGNAYGKGSGNGPLGGVPPGQVGR